MGSYYGDFLFRASSNYGLWGFQENTRVAGGTTESDVLQVEIDYDLAKEPTGSRSAPERLAEKLRQMSNGRLDIKVYGSGELVGAFEVFDSVSQGAAEMGHGAAYYWVGKAAVAPMFATVPGMNAREMNSWLHYGGGIELWRGFTRFNLVPLLRVIAGTNELVLSKYAL